jgi:phosphatidate cytidylyltransferase
MSDRFKNFSNLQLRVATGILGATVFAGLLFAGIWGCFSLFGFLIFFCCYEFFGLSPWPFSNLEKWIKSLVAVACFFILIAFEIFGFSTLPILFFPSILIIFNVFSGARHPFEKTSWTLLGWMYLGLPWFFFFRMIQHFPYEPMLLLGLFGLLWMADSGAYFAGKQFGKTPLLPSVSPKKTWEGLAGGLLASMLLAWILAANFSQFSRNEWLILAASTTLAGVLGDLAESRLKRSLDLKDSGTLLPGHGGFLDRFDGFFVAAPLNCLIAQYFF